MTNSRVFERIESLFDSWRFSEVRVFIAGCGSGGAPVALQLVASGIRNFTLLDRGILDPENVIRHICGRGYLGWKKTEAIADVLRERNPTINSRIINEDLMSYPGLISEILASDVVVLATDDEPSRFRLNEICVQNEKPFVFGRVFARGNGGELFAYRPEQGGCLACLESFLQRKTLREGIKEIDLVSEEGREKVYGMEIEEIKDSAGLAVDISFITSFHARFVLDAIARNLVARPKSLPLLKENYIA
jgi:molybdopterin/thiamine biosynthesis adenylyltransferase